MLSFVAGAVNITATQMASMTAELSSLVPQCSGSEQAFVNCSATALPDDLQTNCMTVARVQCFVSESSAALCGGLPTISPTSTVTVPPDTTVESTTTRPGSITPAAATTGESTTGTIASTTGTTPPSDVSSNNTDPSTTQNLLQPFHYGIIGAVAFLIILILLAGLCLFVFCAKNSRRKRVKETHSPLPGSADDHKSELGEIRYHPEPTHTGTDVLVADSSENEPSLLPIYEAIPASTGQPPVESPIVLNKPSPTETDPLCSEPGTYASLERHQPQYQTLEAFTGNDSSIDSFPTHHPTDSSYSHYLELDRSLPTQKKRTLSATNAIHLHRQNSTGAEVGMLPENTYSTVQESRKKRQKLTASLDRRNPVQFGKKDSSKRRMVREQVELSNPTNGLQQPSEQHTYAILEPPPPPPPPLPVNTQQQQQQQQRSHSAMEPGSSSSSPCQQHHQTQAVNGRDSGEIDVVSEERGSSMDCMDTLV